MPSLDSLEEAVPRNSFCCSFLLLSLLSLAVGRSGPPLFCKFSSPLLLDPDHSHFSSIVESLLYLQESVWPPSTLLPPSSSLSIDHPSCVVALAGFIFHARKVETHRSENDGHYAVLLGIKARPKLLSLYSSKLWCKLRTFMIWWRVRLNICCASTVRLPKRKSNEGQQKMKRGSFSWAGSRSFGAGLPAWPLRDGWLAQIYLRDGEDDL